MPSPSSSGAAVRVTRLGVLLSCGLVLACGDDSDSELPPAAEDAVRLEGTAPAAVRGLPSVVTLEPDEPPNGSASDTLVVDQYAMQFYPKLLVAGVGQDVQFRNSEDVPHNVRVSSVERDSTLFNVFTPQGDPYHHAFEEPGEYEVTCDIHVGMTSFILVTSAPYSATADDDGGYVFTDVPAGNYTRTVWSADPAQRSTDRVEIGAGGSEGS